ncbi:MAG: hypothetical protein IJ721_01315 [Bacteroidales bacterium]|nr:hypothetical protein [Bacteroidales bacterium]
MKKYIALTAAAAALTLSCTKEAEMSLVPENVVTIQAAFPEEPDTKTTLTNDQSLRWTPGDEISVALTDGTDYILRTFTTTSSAATATFTGTVPDGYTLADKAFYPADDRHYYDGEKVKFNIRQEYDETGGASCIPMVATREDGTYRFKAVGGAMKFTYLLAPEDIDRVVFASAISTNGLFPVENGKMVHDKVEFTEAEVADGYKLNRGDITYRQQIAVSVARDAAGTATAYIPLSPQANYGYKRVTVFAKDGSTLFSKDFSYETEIRANRVSVLPSYRFPQDTDVDFSMFNSLSAQAAATGEDAEYVKGARSVKFYADIHNIYGYVEVDIATLGAANLTNLDNLNVWIDNDDIHEGEGGGSALNNPAAYDIVLRGVSAASGRPKAWTPEYRVLMSGDNFGTADASVIEAGSGEGQVLSGVFKYKFTIARDKVGLASASSARIGISFDAGSFKLGSMVIPHRGGYEISLPVQKDFSRWDSIEAATVTGNTQYNGGKNLATKFTYDDTYLYGYMEIDRSSSMTSNNFKYFNVWVDNNGINEGNKGGWLLVNYMGFEYIVRGQAGENGSPIDWKDKHLRVPTSSDSFGSRVQSDLTDTEAFGEGELDPETGVFRWQFRILRSLVGIDKASLVAARVTTPRIGVSFDAGGYAAADKSGMVPDRGGFAVPMLSADEIPDLEDIYNFAKWNDVEALPLNKNNEGGSDTTNPNAGSWCNFTTLKMKVDGETCSLYMEVPSDKIQDYVQLFIDGDGVSSGQYGSDVWMIHSGTGTETLITGRHNGLGDQTYAPTLYKWDSKWVAQTGEAPATGHGWVDTAKKVFKYEISFTKASAGLTADTFWINVQFYGSATGMGNTTTASRRGYRVDWTTGTITQ